MRRNSSFKLLAIVLVYTNVLWPMAILAETTKAAGVVTSLKGRVTVTHAAIPDKPAALQFKDPVFGQDRISTKEESIARVLMGGKALITVRELSELTITEDPGKPSIVDLAKGKIGLAVAKARMGPGESIEVRTPNAVAAIRGTVIVVEVLPAAASSETAPDYRPMRTSFTGQATPVQAPSFISNFHVLKGNIDVSLLGAPGTAPVNIGAGMSISAVGGSLGQPQTSPPVQQLVKGLAPPTQHIGTPTETNQTISNQQMATASNLASLITGVPTTTYTTTSQNLTSPDNKTTSTIGGGTSQSSGGSGTAGGNSTTIVPPTVPPPSALGVPLVTFSGFSPSITLNAPLGLVEHGNATMAPTPQSFPNADVPAPDVTVNPIGSTPSAGQIETPYYATALVTNESNPADRTRQTVILSGGIGLTDSHVVDDGCGAGNVFQVSGADAVIGGSALILKNSSITTSRNVIDITSVFVSCGTECSFTSPGSLTGVSSQALITLDSTSSITANRLVSIDGEGSDPNGLVLVGPALAANGGSREVVNVNVTGDLIYVGNGFLGVASALPLLALSTSNLHASRLLNIASSGTVELGGSLLLAQDSTVTVQNEVLNVSGQFTTDSTLPSVSLSGSSLHYCNSCDTFLNVNNGGKVDLKGGLLAMSGNSTVNGDGLVLVSSGGVLTTGTASVPLVSLNSSTLSTFCCSSSILQVNGGHATLAGSVIEVSGRPTVPGEGGPVPTGPSISADTIVNVSGNGTLSVGGSVLSVTNTTLNPDVTDVSIRDRVILLTGSGSFTGSSTAPLVSLSNSSLTTTNSLLRIFNSGTMTLAGPVLSATGSSLDIGDRLIHLSESGSLTSSSTAPLVSLANSSLTTGGSMVRIGDMGTDTAMVLLGGPLLSVTGTSTLNIGSNMITMAGHPVEGDTLTSAATTPLVQLNGGSLTLSGGLLSADGATITLSGGLFKATGTAITPGASPFLSLTNGASLTAGGTLLDLDLTGKPAVNLGSQPIADITNISTLTTSAGPLIKITGGTFTADSFLHTDGSASHFNLTGTTLDLTNTTAQFRILLDSPKGTDNGIYNLTFAVGEPFLRMTNSNLTVTGTDEPLLERTEDSGPVSQGGVMLIATNDSGTTKTLSFSGSLLKLGGMNFTDTHALVQVTNMTVTQTGTATTDSFFVTDGFPVALHGPLLSATTSAITVNGPAFLQVLLDNTDSGVPQFTSAATSPLVSLSGGTLLLNSGAKGLLLTGDPSASVEIAGTLFSISNGAIVNTKASGQPFIGVNGGTLEVAGDVVNVAIPSSGTGGLIVNGIAPVMAISGGDTHLLGASDNPTSAIFNLSGVRTGTQVVPVDNAATPATVSLTLGTDRPVRGDDGEGSALGNPLPLSTPLFQATNATVNTNQAVRIDTALLEATAPIVNLVNSTMSSASDLVNLVQKAQVIGTVPSDALVKLDASMLNVHGSVFNVAGGSYLNVTGNLVSLNGNSTLNILNGGLVTVSGGSVFSLSGGSLVSFGASGTNALNIMNNAPLCSGCTLTTTIPNLAGVPVLLMNGATASHVSVAPSFMAIAGSGTVNVSGTSGALLVLNGATSRIRLRP